MFGVASTTTQERWVAIKVKTIGKVIHVFKNISHRKEFLEYREKLLQVQQLRSQEAQETVEVGIFWRLSWMINESTDSGI